MGNITKEEIKKLIKDKFSDTDFTIGDILYSIEKAFNRSKFGVIRNIIVALSKEEYLNYRIELRGSPKFNSERKRKGAVYSLIK